MEDHTKVGVGVMVMKDGKVLLAKRKGAHGAGEFCFPGGHLEYTESFEQCALREIAEECGVAITGLRFQLVANSNTYAPKHYIHIGLVADWQAGEPQLLEPEKSESWGWYGLDELPKPLFFFTAMAIDSYQTGKTYYDAA